MNLHLTHASFGGNQASFAAVANDVPASGGQLYIAAVSHTPSVSGQEVATILKEKYKTQGSGNIYASLKTAVEETVTYFSQREADVAISVTVFVGEIVYLGVWGAGEVWIKRGDHLLALAKGQKGHSQFGSGRVALDDIFVLTTNKAHVAKILAEPDDATFALFIQCENPAREPRAIGKGLRTRLVSVIDAILTRLPQQATGIRINDPNQDFKVHNQRKYAVIFGIVLVVLLAVSVVIGMKRNEFVKTKQAYQSELATARQSLEEARSLKDISRDRARSLLLDARAIVATLKQQGIEDPELTIVATSIDDSLGEIAGLYKHDPQLFLDLSLVSNNFVASSLANGDGAVVVFDKENKKLIRADIATKRTEVLAGPDILQSVSDIATYESRVFTLSSDGVYELTSSRPKVISKEWEGDALIFAFAGNMYVLDKASSEIYRYPGVTGGFGGKANWLATDITANLTASKAWAIDGSIWVMSESGKISKFSLGKSDSFFLDQSITANMSAFYTDEESEQVYLLDKDNGKITVVDKKGVFIADYEHPQIKEVTGLIVDTPNKKMILAAASKLFTLEIRH